MTSRKGSMARRCGYSRLNDAVYNGLAAVKHNRDAMVARYARGWRPGLGAPSPPADESDLAAIE